MQIIKSLVSLVFALVGTSALNQLAFSGGGAFGAVEIGILKYLESVSPTKYDFYTGISAGGINAGYLSHFKNLNEGITSAEKFYSTVKNHMVYSIKPYTNVSLLNTEPLYNTMSKIITKLPKPSIDTYIGTTNLYSGNLDIFRYDLLDSNEKRTQLLMCTSAIPVVFPPINFLNSQYADGGTLQNELIDISHDSTYLNITFITPSTGSIYNNTPITSLEQMILRTGTIVVNDFNNAIPKVNSNCDKPIGEINKYSVDSKLLSGYNMLNFNTGDELVDIGYSNVQHEKIVLC
jgi:predicted patatin/cPLA2 family phospholipase